MVSDKEALRAALLQAGEQVASEGSLRVRDPSGNQLEIVDYREVQSSKAPAVLRAMGLEGLEKTEAAREELRAKGNVKRSATIVVAVLTGLALWEYKPWMGAGQPAPTPTPADCPARGRRPNHLGL